MNIDEMQFTKNGIILTAFRPEGNKSEQIEEIIDEMRKMDGITIEIIGCFVRAIDDILINNYGVKDLKFQWRKLYHKPSGHYIRNYAKTKYKYRRSI